MKLQTVGELLDEMDAEREEKQAANLPAVIDEETASIVLLDREQADAFYDRIKAEVSGFEADTTTATGRKAIASEAYRVTKAKTAIDKARKGLTEEWRQKTKLVNEAGKEIVARLDSLAAEVRQPLTEWENAEEKRIRMCRETITSLNAAAEIKECDTSETVRARGLEVWEAKFPADIFGDLLPEAQAAKDRAVIALKAALARLTKEEADAAELEKLRAEKAERDRIEAEKAAAAEAERQRIEAEQLAEQRRMEAEKAEAERIERERQQAAEQARIEAERAHQAELEKERQRVAVLEAEARRKADEEKRIAAEQAAREADQKHRTECKTSAKKVLMDCGASEDVAIKIILAILAGEVPHVRLEF